jgi:hypothetical protein
MEEDVDGDLADIEALNYDDLDSVSKLQKTQRFNDIMQVVIFYPFIFTSLSLYLLVWLNGINFSSAHSTHGSVAFPCSYLSLLFVVEGFSIRNKIHVGALFLKKVF